MDRSQRIWSPLSLALLQEEVTPRFNARPSPLPQQLFVLGRLSLSPPLSFSLSLSLSLAPPSITNPNTPPVAAGRCAAVQRARRETLNPQTGLAAKWIVWGQVVCEATETTPPAQEDIAPRFSVRVTALHNLGVARAFAGDYDEAEVPLLSEK